jgi:hypothetical protein
VRRRAAYAGLALGRGVDPESLAILQQRMGQRIEFEGDGAETMQVGPRGLHSSTFQLILSRFGHTSPCPLV